MFILSITLFIYYFIYLSYTYIYYIHSLILYKSFIYISFTLYINSFDHFGDFNFTSNPLKIASTSSNSAILAGKKTFAINDNLMDERITYQVRKWERERGSIKKRETEWKTYQVSHISIACFFSFFFFFFALALYRNSV